eukprot:CAMPEP_0177751784 /NCGR_PEP_ID=MMETSP0491_2-20121128/563_1 /TAXON_ID=63592 /ORGANISM="Tetraselmis chuii, Strain PLY429" /LENGTH=230 /DNA_ID=CAMNT_0019266929 /DNA_START=194 /DNA_END=883 /DNA_ORIENTATION=+
MPLSAQPIGGKDSLNKRVPKSTKYDKVKGVVNSGFNMKKLEDKFDGRLANIRFRRDENVRRIKIRELEEILRTESVDVLLLDLRDEDDYAQMHIRGAKNYPARMLSRAMNPFTPAILEQSNREAENKIIVIYDSDERKAIVSGNLFFEKGVDNAFMLAAGLMEVSKQIPWMMDGDNIPPEIMQAEPDDFVRPGTAASSMASYQTDAPKRGTGPATVHPPLGARQSSGRAW